MNYGPGYLDFFLDLFSIVLLFDLAALAILTFIFWKKRKFFAHLTCRLTK